MDELTFTDMQGLINSGTIWKLEGAMGRTAMQLIREGRLMLGHTGHCDFWGNYVPSRTEVQAGTKGSYEFVEREMGTCWAKQMQEVA